MNKVAWTTYSIADVGEFLGGATPSTAVPEYWNGKIHWTTSKRLGNSSYTVDSGERFISKRGLENSSTNLIPHGNLLIGTRVGVGKVAVNRVDMAISQDLTGVLVDSSRFNPFFLAFCFSRPEIKNQIIQQARGVTIKGIPREDLKKIEFAAPEKPEQETIAGVLWKIQRAIDTEKKLTAVAIELKRFALRQLFTFGLRGEPQKETDIGPIPESWSLLRAGDIFKLTSGDKRPSDLAPSPSKEKPYPVLGGNGVMGYAAEWMLDRTECLVIGRVGEYCGAVHVARGKVWITDNALYAKEWLNESVRVDYLAEFLSYYDLNRFKRRAGQPLVTQGLINEHSFPIPLPTEQKQFAAILQTIDRKIKIHERKSATLQELFKTMLHELMTGEIRVADLDIDVSEIKS